MIEDSDIDEMHPAGAWEANGMNESSEVEAKWVRVQAALDELGDTLAIRLRSIVLKVSENDTTAALEQLEELIEAIEVFSGPSEAEEGEEE